MILHDIFEQREPYQQAIDAYQQRYIDSLKEKIGYLEQSLAQARTMEERAAIRKRIKEYQQEIVKQLSVNETQPAQKPPAKGLLKGKDLITPQQRVAGATPPKPGMGAAVKDVVGGIKRFVKGEPDQGPTYEAYAGGTGEPNLKATGNANMGLLIKANSFKQVRPVTFEFPEVGPVPLDANQTELISDYYDGLGGSGAQTHFIYNVLSKYEEVDRLMTKLGAPLKKQAELLPSEPGAQGQLPLSEKKKSSDSDDIKPGDIKVARELQKLRAQYPAARSDVEAVARAEIDSSERSQRQLTAIRGANEKQDALLKQLVALDREQGREIDNLDQENDSLEQQLAQVQSTNDRLEQTISQMSGTNISARPSTINLIPGAPADRPGKQQKPKAQPKTKSQAPAVAEPATEPTDRQRGPEVFKQMTRTITQRPSTVDSLKSLRTQDAQRTQEPANVDQFQLTGTEESVKEHGGGIGPRQHWQSLMQEQGRPPMDTINYYFPDINAQSDVEAIRAAIREIVNNPELSKTSKQRLLGQVGMMVQRNRALIGREWRQYLDRFSESMQETFAVPGTTVPRKSVIQGYTVFFNPETRTVSVTRGGDSEEAAIEQARIGTVNLKTFRNAAEKLIDRIEDQMISEGIKDTASATAVIACLLTGGSLQGCATAPQQTSAQQVLKTGQDIGRTVQTAKKITRAGVEAEVNQEIRNLLRGISGHPEELNHSNILRIWKRIKGQSPVQPEPQAPEYGPTEPVKRPATEAKEIHTRDDFVKERDRLLRMINMETDPANKQILKSAIRQLEGRAENEGWIVMQQRMIREDTAALAAEDAILKRIFVRHRDLMMEYGPDKITQAAESVAYNVGDIAHITDEQIQEWVGQVEYILGARP